MAFSSCFSRSLFLSAVLFSPSVSFFLPLTSPSFFRTSPHALAVAPAHCAPARVARAMASDFHANLNVRCGCRVRHAHCLRGPRLLPVWGAFAKEAWETQAVTPSCPITRTHSSRCAGIASSRSRSRSRSLSLCATYPTSPSTQPDARFLPLSPLSRCLPFFSLLLFVFVFAFLLLFVLSSSSLYFFPLLLHLNCFRWRACWRAAPSSTASWAPPKRGQTITYKRIW